ncbi:alpha/beta fold hydrolase [Simiduia sp. 21SJ11W-1]|uniref:alpha/beta fold hydrolase n=1 Tax=Simiduia sp. 21SJ11W-1 TaxID=2909669 RepID=UPI00209CD2BF|nr:alpha/beta fold hydrolase [Simiduia sp. 21SJ11W-1]UTA48537.1 alpha/beta fold hydrolase [Simiduia sp. 21SJ11W-1]
MHQAYPDIRPFARNTLAVNGHQIYVEQAGQPTGVPLLFLHDGPGLGCHGADRRLFDPQRFHMILPDQRGCGRSRPHLALADNRREQLCDDMVALREQLGIEQWVVVGVGWGGLLALTLALREPERIQHLLLIGTGLGRRQELEWLFEEGAPQVFPEAYRHLCKALRVTEGLSAGELLARATDMFQSDNEIERMALARHWGQWMSQCAGLKPQTDLQKAYLEPPVVLAHACLQAAYMQRQWDFDQPAGVLPHLGALQSHGITCVHGRFDMISPLSGVWHLQGVLPDMKIHIVREAGHSVREAAMLDAVVKAQADIAGACNAPPPDCG